MTDEHLPTVLNDIVRKYVRDLEVCELFTIFVKMCSNARERETILDDAALKHNYKLPARFLYFHRAYQTNSLIPYGGGCFIIQPEEWTTIHESKYLKIAEIHPPLYFGNLCYREIYMNIDPSSPKYKHIYITSDSMLKQIAKNFVQFVEQYVQQNNRSTLV